MAQNPDSFVDVGRLETFKGELDNIYIHDIAGENVLGAVKVGENLTIDADGTLNATCSMLPKIFITTLPNSVITCTLAGDVVATETADAQGEAIITVSDFGSYILNAENNGRHSLDTTVNVTAVALYNAAIAFFNATVVVIGQEGTNVSYSCAGETSTVHIDHTMTAYVTVNYAEEYTFTATMDDFPNAAFSSVLQVTEGTTAYSINVVFDTATIKVTTEPNATVSLPVNNKTATANGNGIANLHVYGLGDYEVTSEINGISSNTKTVPVTANGSTVPVTLDFIRLHVTGHENQTVTVTKDANVYNGTINNLGMTDFLLPETGTWIVEGEGIADNYRRYKNVSVEVTEYITYNADVWPVLYGIYLDTADAIETTCIHDIPGLDNEGFAPVAMDFQADACSIGGWANAFFMPKPCMLRTDGAVDYYLNTENYAEKEDGSPSDIADETYDGNAMMEFPVAYIKVINDTANNRIYFLVSDSKIDDDYECYPCLRADGAYNDNFYYAIYEGCTVDNKLRSLSGKSVSTSTDTNFANLLTRASNNGTGYLMTTWSDEDHIRVLGMMILKRLNSQLAIGFGNNKQGTDYTTGAGNEKGMFYGTEAQNDVGVKFFGIENLWGSRYRRILGIMTDDANNVYLKNTLHRGDGSTGTTYMGQSYYKNLGQIAGTGFQAYFTKIAGQKGYMTMPTEANGGSNTTYFCDQGDVSANRLLVAGGFGLQGGLFAFRNSVNNKSTAMIGASLTYRRS